jgi:SAM-dependent methyltransferase
MESHLEAIGIGRVYEMRTINCEVCGSNDFAELQMRGRIGPPGTYGPLPILICNVCGFKQINPRYEDRFYLDYYEELYRKVSFDEDDAVPSEKYLGQQTYRGNAVRQWVEGVTGPGNGRRTLDHGCASGATMLSWRDNGWLPVGIDPHRPSVELGKERFGLDIQVAPGEKLPFREGEFDLVLSLGSLEHVYDLDKAMNELRRVLRRGGHLAIRWRSDVIFGSPLEYYNHNHYRYFSRNTWRLLLWRYGFEVIKETDQRLEGWDSYEYTLAKSVDDRADVRALVGAGQGDNARQILLDHKDLRREFANRCRQFIDFVSTPGRTAADVVRAVRSSTINWRGLLGGEPDAVVQRAVMEAKLYLEQISRHPEFLG